VVEENSLQQKRNIAQTGNRALLNLKPLWSLELAVDQRNIDLQREAFVDLITADELRDRTVQVLAGRIWNFVSIILKRSKPSELLAYRAIPASSPPWQSRGLRLRYRIELRRETTTEIARATIR
jgi:hypothetical protein